MTELPHTLPGDSVHLHTSSLPSYSKLTCHYCMVLDVDSRPLLILSGNKEPCSTAEVSITNINSVTHECVHTWYIVFMYEWSNTTQHRHTHTALRLTSLATRWWLLIDKCDVGAVCIALAACHHHRLTTDGQQAVEAVVGQRSAGLESTGL